MAKSKNTSPLRSEPRLLSLNRVASYFGVNTSALVRMMPVLKKNGFPDALPLFGLWDRKVLDLWLDRIGGIRKDRISFYPPEAALIGSRFAPVLRKNHVVAAVKSDPNGYTVAEAIDNYLTWFRTHGRDVRSIQYYASSYILPHFGHRVVMELTPPEIRAWHEGLANSPRTRHRGTDYTELFAGFIGPFHDLRRTANHRHCLDPDPVVGYPTGQALAAEIIAKGGNGLLYQSVRRPIGTCLVAFHPHLVQNVRQGAIWRLEWAGTPTPLITKP